MSRAQLTSTVEQNTGGAVSPYVAGKNKIINGDFGVWQRGTSFSNPVDNTYTADRFLTYQNGTGATRTISAQTFTTGTAPVSGYEGTYFFRYLCSALGTGNTYQSIQQRVEDVRQLAGQTATFSFWAKADAAKTITLNINQNFGTGGSSIVNVDVTSTFAVTTSWQRFTKTVTIPSISGKTIGTGSFLQVGFEFGSQTLTLDIWGIQLEAGSTATAFQTATGTVQGELAACKRYFEKSFQLSDTPANGTTALSTTVGAFAGVSMNNSYSTYVPFQVEKRTASPTITLYGNSSGYWGYTASSAAFTYAATAFTVVSTGSNSFSGSQVQTNNTFLVVTGHWTASAEL